MIASMIQIIGTNSSIVNLLSLKNGVYIYGLYERVLPYKRVFKHEMNSFIYQGGTRTCVMLSTNELIKNGSYHFIEEDNEVYFENKNGRIMVKIECESVISLAISLLEEKEKVKNLEKLLEEKNKDIELYRSTREFIEDFEKLDTGI